ncbi:type I-C CRISPR-associated protein Cas8c/Csd1 [Candidatus Fermentibacteria bacterium]|nr:type I-C CRISPR-associated protein Cas8c/Csd1 [Candidatus Fermentibacteria bacterium]
MVLHALYELHDRLVSDAAYGIAPSGFSYQRISFVVVVNPDGALHAIEDARIPAGERFRPRRVLVPGGAKKTGSGLNPCFLWDNPAYLLGYAPDKPERAVRAFEAFRDRHLGLESEIGLSDYSAVCRFLEHWDPAEAVGHPILADVGPGFGVFQIRGHAGFVHDQARIREWWERALDIEGNPPEGQCIVTGELSPLARLHPSIKGVAGANSSGASMVSFNVNSYESYGKHQSFNAPVSTQAAQRYTTALNVLLDGPQRDKHRLVVGDITVVFWTDRPSDTEDIFLRFASEGSASLVNAESQDTVLRAKLEAFLQALRRGRDAYGELEESPETTSYYILGLSPNAARIVVRFFHQGTVFELLDNLRRHFSAMATERQWGDDAKRPDPEFPPVYVLLRQTAREAKDIPPVLGAPLLKAIIVGTRYPAGLYQAVMRRIAADRTINYPRACVIKGYLVRNLGKEVPVSLDGSREDPAYRLGRLFAVLEKTQADALGGGTNATIRDRFYSSASATPAIVFPRLLRTYQHHLAKLEGGRKVVREKLVQEILDPIEGFPTHLALPEQGLFALGYYHQMNDLFRPKETGTSDT